jgi:hypothetical protein
MEWSSHSQTDGTMLKSANILYVFLTFPTCPHLILDFINMAIYLVKSTD